jgi:hypothetical protein
MTLHIEALDHCDREILRALLIDAADQLAGPDSCLLEARLPWDGHPVLFADADRHPVLVSFDLENSQAALLNGLHASDQLATALPWVNQVYEALESRQKAPRLVVVTAGPPPGNQATLSGDGALRLFTCKVLGINGETGLLLEPLDRRTPRAGSATSRPAEPRLPASTAKTSPAPDPATDQTALSEREIAYFQQL